MGKDPAGRRCLFIGPNCYRRISVRLHRLSPDRCFHPLGGYACGRYHLRMGFRGTDGPAARPVERVANPALLVGGVVRDQSSRDGLARDSPTSSTGATSTVSSAKPLLLNRWAADLTILFRVCCLCSGA